jgi:hypothetical protein
MAQGNNNDPALAELERACVSFEEELCRAMAKLSLNDDEDEPKTKRIGGGKGFMKRPLYVIVSDSDGETLERASEERTKKDAARKRREQSLQSR